MERFEVTVNGESHASYADLADAKTLARYWAKQEPSALVLISDHSTGELVLGWWLA